MTIELNDANLFAFSWWSLAALAVFAHNFWLIAKKQKERVRIEANTGHNFPGGESAVKPARVREFKTVTPSNSTAITDFRIKENSLVAAVEMPAAQSFYAAIELRPHPITLDAQKFAGYIRDEDAARFVAPGFIENETLAPQRESYSKFAKVFCAFEQQTAIDNFTLAVGQRFEIVPQTAFRELKAGNLRVQVLFENKPIKNLRVSSGCENTIGAHSAAHARCDEHGVANLEITTAGQWLIRTHFIRPHEDSGNYEWESFWASLTFTI